MNNGLHVRVRAGGEHYALPVAGVREIAPLGQITPVPGAPAAILGVWNLRGDVVAAIDLAQLLGLRSDAEATRIIVGEDGAVRAGLVVDTVTDVGTLPEALEPADSEFLAAAALIDGEPVGIVDLGAVLAAAGRGAG
jgi:purine-binding chemotaxis protein CheW